MSTGLRRQGREIALKIIYSLPDQPESIDRVLADFWRHYRFRDDILGEPLEDPLEPVPEPIRSFAESLVRGVADCLDQLDELLREHSTNWSLERMSRVDLALLRLGAYELLKTPEVPVNVVINEAIEIGKRYGTEETPGFVNGILDKISRLRQP